MRKVIAKIENNQIVISGYLNSGVVVVSDKGIKADLICDSYVNERELSELYQRLVDQLSAHGKSYGEVRKLINGSVEIDFSTKLDIEDLLYDLNKEGEAKVNVTGDSESHINKLIGEIRLHIEDDAEIVIDNENSRKGYKSTYIRIYA